MKERSGNKVHFKALHASFFAIVTLALFFLINCWPYRFSLPSLSSRIERIEGYSSIKITQGQESTRTKFSFQFQLPHQGRIEVLNLLGKTLYQIIIDEEEAFFVLPSKKVYWKGEEEEIVDKFLGFRLNLYEMLCLLSGQWEEKGEEGRKKCWTESWNLEKDEKGRISGGQRGELRFEIKEFFEDSSFPRLIVFQHPINRGRLKVLRLSFNKPIKEGAFSVAFLANYEEKSWAEIEKILSNEN